MLLVWNCLTGVTYRAMTWETKDVVIVVTAALGAGLGILNFWRTWANDRVEIRVALESSIDKRRQVISVTNLSSFPVSIIDVGAIRESGELESIHLGELTNGPTALSLPCRIESRDSKDFPLNLRGVIKQSISYIVGAYARTACGKTVLDREYSKPVARLRRLFKPAKPTK